MLRLELIDRMRRGRPKMSLWMWEGRYTSGWCDRGGCKGQGEIDIGDPL